MKISFLLPFSGHRPVGGFRVVYEYANGLAGKGHDVSVIHSPYLKCGEKSAVCLARQKLVYLAKAIGLFGGYRPDRWFQLNPAVNIEWVPSLSHRWVPTSDAVVATAWETAEWVSGYPIEMGRKYYLIQHLESTFPDAIPERAMATWKTPLFKIVIARWLRDIATDMGEDSFYIPNGLNFRTFDLDTPIECRDRQSLIMLYHHHDWKGSSDGLAAIMQAKKEESGLKATLFGLPKRPVDLPEWIVYEQNPSQQRLRRLYNNAAIFVGPSWAEGWPLPPAEAAQCGTALCVTDIGGHREYAIPYETALLSPSRDTGKMASNIVELVRNNELRTRLALQAHEHIRQFTWERATKAMEECLQRP